MTNSILVFAGTIEGRKLGEFFSKEGIDGEFSVATSYGKELLEDIPNIRILEGRLTLEDMIKKFKTQGYTLIIDATHPYAVEVTANIKKACDVLNIRHIRLLREETQLNSSNIVEVDTMEEAIKWLNTNDEKALLTTGSKELKKYMEVNNYKERLFPRILPTKESLDLALEAEIPSRNIICMQGPFTYEMNIATMEQFKCKIMVSKNTGKQGGMDGKIQILKKGFKLLIIGRPAQEEGLSFKEVTKILKDLKSK